jgi:hypothetical protein
LDQNLHLFSQNNIDELRSKQIFEPLAVSRKGRPRPLLPDPQLNVRAVLEVAALPVLYTVHPIESQVLQHSSLMKMSSQQLLLQRDRGLEDHTSALYAGKKVIIVLSALFRKSALRFSQILIKPVGGSG